MTTPRIAPARVLNRRLKTRPHHYAGLHEPLSTSALTKGANMGFADDRQPRQSRRKGDLPLERLVLEPSSR